MKQLLSSREMAHAVGVSESSLKRWTNDGLIRATRTHGGHRRIALTEAIRFIRENDVRLVRPELLDLPDVAEVSDEPPPRGDEVHRLLDYLETGQAGKVRGLVMAMYLDGRSVAEICDNAIGEAMRRIADVRRHDARSIFIEHRATDICIQAVNQLRTTFESERGAVIAVGGAPSHDPYVLPSLMAATVLMSERFHVINLGPDTPTEALLVAARDNRPLFAWLSATAMTDRAGLNRQTSALADGMLELGVSLIVGGRAFENVRPPSHRNVSVGRTMSELVAFARGLAASRHNRPNSDRMSDS